LLLNACEAAPALGGRVGVDVSENAGAITIEVSDNGPGVADSIRDKLFHPFVSYGKENGTGLGLAVVQKIVQDHRGEIVVERTPNARTVFRILLPGRWRETLAVTDPPRVPSFVPAKRDGLDPDSISASGHSGQ
jgi:signal transduction histidine kinase